jgi:hypothetical protein
LWASWPVFSENSNLGVVAVSATQVLMVYADTVVSEHSDGKRERRRTAHRLGFREYGKIGATEWRQSGLRR